MAKRFQFPLQTLLRQRELVEERRKRELADALRRVDEERLRLEDFRKEREATQTELNAVYRDASRFGEVVDVMRYMTMLDREIHASGERLKGLEAEADKRRAALVVAQRERRVVELVKERKFEEWKREVAREEQKRVDDMAIRAHDRALREAALEGAGDAPVHTDAGAKGE